MLKIIRLEQKTASRNYEIDNRYKSISCKYCHSMATHILITGEYSNYEKSLICNKCSDHMNNLTCYELDIRKIVDIYKL